MRLQNASVLITGGSLGIGKATAALFSQGGAKVFITGRNKSRLETAAEAIGAQPIVADVGKEEDAARSIEQVLKAAGKLDCLINNAGVGGFGPVSALDAAAFEQVWQTNVLGAALMAKHAARVFEKQRYGNIVNIASTAATRGFEGGTMYVASKFALRGMSECWRTELRKFNVRVILINPSEVPTAFGSKDGSEKPEQANKLTPKEIAYAIKSALEMDDRGFIPELNVFATNPF